MCDVMFYEAFEEEKKVLRETLPGCIRAEFTSKTIQESKEKSPRAAVISIRTQSRIPSSWAKDIKGILTRSQGYDHLVMFQREVEKDIACGYLGSYCARAVAEHAVLLMLALLRNLKKQTRQFDSFTRDGITGRECKGLRALVIGVGNIGSQIVDMARGLRMDVYGVDIAPTTKDLCYVSLTRGLTDADVIFCALPLTDQTEGMLNYELLKSARPGAVLINIARGEISPLNDLNKLLEEGILGGLGMDVYSQEDLLAGSLRAGEGGKTSESKNILELAQRDNVIFTPHNAFNTQEALKQKALLTVTSIEAYLKTGTFLYPIPAA